MIIEIKCDCGNSLGEIQVPDGSVSFLVGKEQDLVVKLPKAYEDRMYSDPRDPQHQYIPCSECSKKHRVPERQGKFGEVLPNEY